MKTAILAAMTLDGKLAHNSSQFVDWTSKEDKRLFYGATKRAGVMVLGSNTFETFPEPLPNRLHVVMTHSTESKENTPGLVEYTAASPQDILEDLETRGFSEVIIGGGGEINALFLKEDLVDEVWLTIEPLIFGMGIELFHGFSTDRQAHLFSMEKLNDNGTLHLRYTLR